MRCPFLREAQVKFCRSSAFRKMIVRLPGQPQDERCTSPRYVDCPDARQRHEERPSFDHCPFLHESLVQYCSAAPVTRYIPYSESVLGQCGSDSHKYCELFRAFENPLQAATDGGDSKDGLASRESGETMVGGIHMPSNLYFSSNHMWLDPGADGTLHIGIDGFMTRVLGCIDRLFFLTHEGYCRPAAVLTVRGIDLHIAFPHELFLSKTNRTLRTEPSKLFSDPYSAGWLFEGHTGRNSASDVSNTYRSFLKGSDARSWIRNEVKRLNDQVHTINSRPDLNGETFMADGGEAISGLMQHLNREEILHVFNEFFSPFAGWRGKA